MTISSNLRYIKTSQELVSSEAGMKMKSDREIPNKVGIYRAFIKGAGNDKSKKMSQEREAKEKSRDKSMRVFQESVGFSNCKEKSGL